MSIKIGEIGKELYIGMGYDVSANTEVTIYFTSPDETITFSRASADGVTAPAVPSPSLPDIGILAANEYLLYLTQAADFTVSGAWCVYGEYTEGATKLFKGNEGTLTIEDEC